MRGEGPRKERISPGARAVLERLTAEGYEAYLVGGCVRDLLRGVEPHDWDICTSARPEETAACFDGERVLLTGLKHGTVTVLLEGEPYEVTTFRSDGTYSDGRRPDGVRFLTSLEGDLERRDFTINAIALGADGALRDPFGGEEDLKQGVIRCVGDPERRFQEDGLRLMRALRFSACLGFPIRRETAEAIHRCAGMLDRVSVERIQVELCRLLTGPRAVPVLREYPDLLCRFWPELGPLVMQEERTPRPLRGGWEHTLRAVEAAPPELTVRLAVLLCNVGRSADGAGADRISGREETGAETADKMLRALRFENATRKQVTELVRLCCIPLEPDEGTVRRWLSRLGPELFRRLLEVKRADILARETEMNGAGTAELEQLRELAEELVARGECLTLKELAVNGRDAIAAGIPAGPAVGRTLERLLERVLDGELPNRREVLLASLNTAAEGEGDRPVVSPF